MGGLLEKAVVKKLLSIAQSDRERTAIGMPFIKLLARHHPKQDAQVVLMGCVGVPWQLKLQSTEIQQIREAI